MEFLIWFSDYAEYAMICCMAVSIGLVAYSPMSKLLRISLFGSLVPFFLATYYLFLTKTEKTLAAILKAYKPEKSKSNFFEYNEYFVSGVFEYIKNLDIALPILSVLGVAFSSWLLVTIIMNRYFSDKDVAGPLLSVLVGILAVVASYGILLPVIFIGFFFANKKAKSVHRVIEGKEALGDMYQGFLRIKLKLLAHRKNGIFIHQLLRIPKKFENRGMIIFGAPGSGKTHLIKTFYIPQFRKRGDMTVIFDYKGDFTENIGEEEDALIISPIDARSAIWDIATDIDTETMAWEFGRMVVQTGDSPTDRVFEDWARDLLTASLIKLQREKKADWTFKDFYEQSQNLDTLIEAVGKYRKESQFAANFEGDSKQFEGIKGTIRQAMVRLEPLSRAWGNIEDRNKLFSIKGWLEANGGLKPTIIIRYDPLYSETMGPFVSNFLNFVMTSVLSLPDAKGATKERRIWAVLDEFQILPKIPKLFEAARAGRSKGLRMLLGTQDLGQTDQTYRKEGGRDTLVNLMGFKLIGHLGSEGMQNFAAGLLSKNKVVIQNKNVQQSNGKTSITYSESTKLEPAISPGEFGSIPLPTAYNGSLFWMVHQGWHPVKLRFVTKTLPDKFKAQLNALWLGDADREHEVIPVPKKQVKKLKAKVSLKKPEVKPDKKFHESIYKNIEEIFTSVTGKKLTDFIPKTQGV